MTSSARERTRVALGSGYRLELSMGAARSRDLAVALDATVVVVLSGAADVRVGESIRPVEAPGLALVDPGTAFRVEPESDGERLVVALAPEALAEAAVRLELGRDGVVLFRRDTAPATVPVELTARHIAHEVRSPAGSAAALDAAVALFAVDLVRDYGHVNRSARLERSRAGLVDRRLRRSVEFMHDNFARDLPLGEIAAAAYLSDYHFARLFKRITGVTPHAYLAELRMEQARRLLATSDLGVAEIAARVGYQSASHFGKVFRQVVGTTPTAFRDDVLQRGDRRG